MKNNAAESARKDALTSADILLGLAAIALDAAIEADGHGDAEMAARLEIVARALDDQGSRLAREYTPSSRTRSPWAVR